MQDIPLYIQVRNRIKEDIENGNLDIDDNGLLPGQAVFADKYNVSLATVSRAISDLGKIGLVESRRGRGLSIKMPQDAFSRELEISNENRVLHIGVAVVDAFYDFSMPFTSMIMSGINDMVKDHNISTHIISFPSLDMKSQQETFFVNFPFTNLDGVIILSPINARSITYLNDRKIPYVSGVSIDEQNVIMHLPDKFEGVRSITNAVLKRKPDTTPLIFLGDINNPSCHTLYCTYKTVLEMHNLKPDQNYISYEHYDIEKAIEFIENLIKSGRKLESIIACDDYMASKLIDYVNSIGGDDIIVASGGMFHGYEDKIKITLNGRLHEIGSNLMKSLLDTINGKELGKQFRFYYEPYLIERDNF